MRLLTLTLIVFLASRAGADDLRVLAVPEAAGNLTPAAKFEAWLRAEFEKQVDRRTAAFDAAIKSRSACEQWQKQRREFFLQQIGGLPERTPLNPMLVGKLEGDGYLVEKLLLESRPGFHITANLYLPKSPPPWPAVLVPCGHSHEGKAVGQYQRISILLARHGMAAICYDPIGQGERYQVLDTQQPRTAFPEAPHVPTPHPAAKYLCTTEHTLIGLSSALVGENVAQFRIWDGMRVIDYLQSRPDIRADKIGCCGNSGGGTETAYLMALDDRIVAAAPGCYLTTFRRLIETKGPQDGEQNIFGQIAFGMDQADYCAMAAPRPVLICAGVRDATFDFRGTADLFIEAKRFYSRLGIPERIELNAPDAPHGFTVQQREATARWMHRWLVGGEKEIREVPDLPDQLTDDELRAYSEPVWKPEQLQCTPAGQVLLLGDERSAFQLNAAAAERLRVERTPRWKALKPGERRKVVAETIGAAVPISAGQATAAELQVENLSTIRRDGYTIHKLALSTEGAVRLPALAFVPDRPAGPATLYLHGTGMAADAGPDGPIERLVRAGHIVLSAELRGIGETETGHDKRAFGKGRFGPDNLEIFLAYLCGRSYVGMRTDDARLWANYLAAGTLGGTKPTELHVAAEGEAAIPALHAAALQPADNAAGRFRTVTLRRMIASWESLVAAPETFNQSVNVVHGVLRHYDLADLVPLTEAEVTITETADAQGEPVATADMEVTAAPMVVVRERPGITGAGWVSNLSDAAQGSPRLQLLYPNHPDDFGKSAGTGASISTDGGRTWTAAPDDTPLAGVVDAWSCRLADGDLLAIGIRRLPDPKTRTAPVPTPGEGPAWILGRSTDQGASWKIEDCTIDCPAALGVIARPLPPIVEDADGTLSMPAYAWSNSGNRALLLTSHDRGRSWNVASTIVDAAAIRAAGIPVTTPWMETTIARTTDGGWLAVVRTGSSAKSALVQVRSSDGRTWEPPQALQAGVASQPVAGKLPSLVRLAAGPLVLLTAHTNNHCRLYISPDGTGRRWSDAYVVTSQSGGNTSLAAVGGDRLVVVTPANNRLHGWPITVRPAGQRAPASALAPPTDVKVAAGPSVRVSWSAPQDRQTVARYRITPQLIAAANPDTEAYNYATIETSDAATHLELGRVLSIGGSYQFRVEAVDRDGRISLPAESAEAVVGLAAPAAAQ
jgi:dienelactone hydrolase